MSSLPLHDPAAAAPPPPPSIEGHEGNTGSGTSGKSLQFSLGFLRGLGGGSERRVNRGGSHDSKYSLLLASALTFVIDATVIDGQPQKRRGPKPDSKPALTRRQELNRQAQRYIAHMDAMNGLF